MGFLSNLHTHSTFSDGKNSQEEVIETALEKGFVSLGFSDHSYVPGICSYCMNREQVRAYSEELFALKEKYRGQIEIYTGIEWDYYTEVSQYEHVDFDYQIGAVHYFKDREGNCYDVDYTLEIFQNAVVRIGSTQAALQNYYESLVRVVTERRPEIVAHFDLVQKVNDNKRIFDEEMGWYQNMVEEALKEVKKTGSIIEVNTGGIFRGYMKAPYPSRLILKKVLDLGIPVTLSSDSHQRESIDFFFPEAAALLKEIGFTAVKRMRNGVFEDVPLGEI